MRNKFIQAVETAHQKKEPPKFDIGDTVSVGVRIVEGNKERIQPFIGVVIARRGEGIGAMFTVRRLVADEGVERIFPLHSPRIANIEVVRHGKIRRGKLYYLRDRVGKARKLRERRLATATEGAEGATEVKSAPARAAESSGAKVPATV